MAGGGRWGGGEGAGGVFSVCSQVFLSHLKLAKQDIDISFLCECHQHGQHTIGKVLWFSCGCDNELIGKIFPSAEFSVLDLIVCRIQIIFNNTNIMLKPCLHI